MNIGILGTGAVGRALGTGFADAGDDVMMGARDAKNAKARAWVAATGRRASAGTFGQAAEFGDVIVLATLWSGTENAIKLARPQVIAEKIVLDVTNPIVFTANAPPVLALGLENQFNRGVHCVGLVKGRESCRSYGVARR